MYINDIKLGGFRYSSLYEEWVAYRIYKHGTDDYVPIWHRETGPAVYSSKDPLNTDVWVVDGNEMFNVRKIK